MEKVIGLLFDIEKKANQIIERANIEKTELFNENEKAILDMETKITEENNQKIKALLEQAELELEKEKEQLIKSSEEQLKSLEEYYNKNHDDLVEAVFQKITKI